MGILNVLLKSLQLKINFEAILAADIAILGLIELNRLSFFSQLREFIDNGASEDLEDDFLSK